MLLQEPTRIKLMYRTLAKNFLICNRKYDFLKISYSTSIFNWLGKLPIIINNGYKNKNKWHLT